MQPEEKGFRSLIPISLWSGDTLTRVLVPVGGGGQIHLGNLIQGRYGYSPSSTQVIHIAWISEYVMHLGKGEQDKFLVDDGAEQILGDR